MTNAFRSRWGISNDTLQTFFYSVPAGTNQILAWYRQNMKGWTLKQESTGQGGSFQKYSVNDQTGALILALSGGSDSQAFLFTATGPWGLVQSLGSPVDLSAPGPFFAPGRGRVTFTVSPVSPDEINYITPLAILILSAAMSSLRTTFTSFLIPANGRLARQETAS